MTAKMKMTFVWLTLIVLIVIALALIAVSSGGVGSIAGWNPQPLGHCVASYCSTI